MGSDNLYHRRKAKTAALLKRRKAKRSSYDTVLIVCEGEKTEPKYFRALIDDLQLNTANIIIADNTAGSSPRSVVEFALREYNKDKEKADQILIRIGIHIGDLLIENNDVFGNGINVAAKIEPLAEPGGICVSVDAYTVVKNSIDINVVSIGRKELKNIKDSPEIFKILIE